METEEKGNPLPAIMLMVAIFAVGAAFTVGLGWLEPSKQVAAQVQPAEHVAAIPDFQLGEIVTVKSSCVAMMLAATPEIATTWERLLQARDREGRSELMKAELVYVTDTGGRVRIIGFDSEPEKTRRLGCDMTWIQVRALDGDCAGIAGWIDVRCLKR